MHPDPVSDHIMTHILDRRLLSVPSQLLNFDSSLNNRPLTSSMLPSAINHQSRGSWIDIGSDSDDIDIDCPRTAPSTVPSTSPLEIQPHPRHPTPSASAPVVDDSNWAPRADSKYLIRSPSAYPTDLPAQTSASSRAPVQSFSHSPLLRSASEGESSFVTDPTSPRSFARPPKSMLPDPSQFPDPYPFRPPHHHLTSTVPALSSAGSSSASTRSSAYTSSGSALASGDYGHVHVVAGEDESNVGVGITSDDVVQLLESDSQISSPSLGMHSRAPIDQIRWSESYSGSIRSRSSSLGNGGAYDNGGPKLREKLSYDMGWQTVDERDEVGVSEEETDDDQVLVEEEGEEEEERTSAVVVAEEGRGLIVRGDGLPIVQLEVHPGTTHLLVGSSSTPNGMFAFLTSILPQICNTLLALDISANFLGALPPCLASCTILEELNIASNPLRVLPDFLADLSCLRVLIADSTGISSLPDALSELDKLHTLSIRRNKMHSLPSWLSILGSLQTLFLDGNPFQGPWKALIEPLLAKDPVTLMYPTSTPTFPLPSASVTESPDDTEQDSAEYLTNPRSASSLQARPQSFPEEDDTITRAGLSLTNPGSAPPLTTFGTTRLTRTRTTPNRDHLNKSRNGLSVIETKSNAHRVHSMRSQDSGYFGNREIRKMKSAGELRRHGGTKSLVDSPNPTRPGSIHPASASSSNLLSLVTSGDGPSPKRFASLSSSSSLNPRGAAGARTPLTQSLWAGATEPKTQDVGVTSPGPDRVGLIPTTAHEGLQSPDQPFAEGQGVVGAQSPKDNKEPRSRWGFLKKMSMGKMRIDSPSRQSVAQGRPHAASTSLLSPNSLPFRTSTTPQIDVRFSTTGTLGNLTAVSNVSPATISVPLPVSPNPGVSLLPAVLEKKPSLDSLKVPSPSPSLLRPPSPSPRSGKRRSFLPLEGPPSLNIPIPDAASFVPGVTASNGHDSDEGLSPGLVTDTAEHQLRREEERARESYTRALRSVMAYLKDMNDLGSSQQPNPISIYGVAPDEVPVTRSRRPTESGRDVSMAINASNVPMPDLSEQLRSKESRTGLRNGTANQTLSVATTDSNGSAEERKFKDDKCKRAMVVREIIETERTYVKGLQELVDIYIKPGSAPANLIGGVGSSKDTVVPSSERKIVFSSVEALFSFHHESFLPALEVAAAPLMAPSSVLQDVDAEGQLSLSVAKAVGNVFLKHAAFLKMYSSYINNFENSVQRVKVWMTDRPTAGNASPATSLSPSSSTVHLASLALAASAISAPGLVSDTSSVGSLPSLSSGQRKRIRSYMKKCRMHPRHSQLNLEGYLLLPVQRIPRYRLLLEELLRSSPPTYEFLDDPLERALTEITSLANIMNEGKRESESRHKLVQWQSRIRGKFPSPLVQPHRRLIMDGRLLLTRVVRKTTMSFEAINAQGDASIVQVDCLAPELTPRSLIGILCNDLLVLCRDPSEGQDPTSSVDLWAVLRMQTLPQPASIVHGNALRLVDNKAILYFDAPSPSDALNWYRAINLHIPASKT